MFVVNWPIDVSFTKRIFVAFIVFVVLLNAVQTGENIRSKLYDEYYAKRKVIMDKYKARIKELEELRQSLIRTQTAVFPPFATTTTQKMSYPTESYSSSLHPSVGTTLPSEYQSTTQSSTSNRQPYYFQLGNFEGYIMYSHVIRLSGANHTDFPQNHGIDVAFDGICITGVEAFPQNGTRASVSVTSGGPKQSKVSIQFKEINNEDYEYAVKVWGVPNSCQ